MPFKCQLKWSISKNKRRKCDWYMNVPLQPRHTVNYFYRFHLKNSYGCTHDGNFPKKFGQYQFGIYLVKSEKQTFLWTTQLNDKKSWTRDSQSPTFIVIICSIGPPKKGYIGHPQYVKNSKQNIWSDIYRHLCKPHKQNKCNLYLIWNFLKPHFTK